MQQLFLTIGFLLFFFWGQCQLAEPTILPEINESAWENLATESTSVDAFDNDDLDQLEDLKKNPILINEALAESYRQFSFLLPIQIESLMQYLKHLGDLNSIYELQSIPYWDLETIYKIQPYVAVKQRIKNIDDYKHELYTGSHQMVIRTMQTLEKSKGYTSLDSAGMHRYPGPRMAISFRYRFQYKKDLQYGLSLDKDAGEAIAFNKKTKGFDFISFHLFKTSTGFIKKIALGDFVINMGQGLIQWQSMAFNKSTSTININRQSPFLKPHQSFGESNFYSGIGMEMAFKNFSGGLFCSSKKIDANMVTDTLLEKHFSAFQTSGFHRTTEELADKSSIHQWSFGGNLSCHFRNGKIGLNTVFHHFNFPLEKSEDLYNFYAAKGKRLQNISIDYSMVWKNSHFFGEAATNILGIGIVNGVQVAVSSKLDWVIVHRQISNSFQSLYSNAFTESSEANSEHGFYNGFAWRPTSQMQFNLYTDFFQKTWVGYNKNDFEIGKDLMVNWKYSLNKKSYLELLYALKKTQVNNSVEDQPISNAANLLTQRFRGQMLLAINSKLSIKTRIETKLIHYEHGNRSYGFLMYTDFYYKPMMRPYAFFVRAAIFQTDNYDARIYAYERDLPLSYSMSMFYDKGFRWCVNTKIDITKKMSCWLKWSLSYYPEKATIGSGNDEITGNKRNDIKLQLAYEM